MRPLRQALRWIEAELGPRARVVRARPLRGGVASVVHAVTVARGASRMQVVLRRHDGRTEEHARLVEGEARILRGLERVVTIPAPRLVAADARGTRAGDPALLMTKLAGQVLLAPVDRDDWLRRLAVTLCAIHDLPPVGERFEARVAGAGAPAWSARRGLWRRALAVLEAGLPEPAPRRTHGDYQHFNILWSRGRIRGVLDWGSSRNGPVELDVGHCRLNLAVLFSPDVAERFREIYEGESGRSCDPRWDLAAMTAYLGDHRWPDFIPLQVAGRAAVDVKGMDDRVERLVEKILARAGARRR